MKKLDSCSVQKNSNKDFNYSKQANSQKVQQEGTESSNGSTNNNNSNSKYRTRPLLYPIKSGNFDILYSEEADGEILVEMPKQGSNLRLITCVDISTLYKEKRNKAIEIAKEFSKLQHPNLLSSQQEFQLLDNNGTLIFYTEAPDHIAGWKSYCKKKFTTDEMLCIFRQLCEALAYVHDKGIIHRDVHPTRIHSTYGLAKFNLIGMPYNYKKLLKKDNFCGHVNYSAPELIQEKVNFSPKVDIWSLGCCLYYLCTKKDPFEGRNPQEIKQNIMVGRLEKYPSKFDQILKTLINKCLEKDENKRLDAREMLEFQDQLEFNTYGETKSISLMKQIVKNYNFMREHTKEYSQDEIDTMKSQNPQGTYRYKNPQFFINIRYNNQENDEREPGSYKRDGSSAHIQQSEQYQARVTREQYYEEEEEEEEVHERDSLSQQKAQFQQNYKQYKQQQKSYQNGQHPTLESYARHSVKQNFQSNFNQLYKKQQYHQHNQGQDEPIVQQMVPNNYYQQQSSRGPQVQRFQSQKYENDWKPQESSQMNNNSPPMASSKTKGNFSVQQSQGSKKNESHQPQQIILPQQQQLQLLMQQQDSNVAHQYNLTQVNLDKFNSQFYNNSSTDMKSTLMTSISEDKVKPDQKTKLIEQKEEFKIPKESIVSPINNSTDCIVQGADDNAMPYSIFNRDCIFLDQFNSSECNEQNNSDILKDITQGDPSSNESRNEFNKEEIEGIVAQIVESSKRVKNQLHYFDGTKYVGEVMRHGYGIFYEQDGSIYDGEWYEDQKNGKGKMLQPDGSVYDGQWEGDKMHGKGVFISCNGDRYEGYFNYGLKEGKGTIYYKNGNSYSGQWKNDTLWGKGLFNFKNGNYYEGHFVNGLFEGQGQMFFVGVGTYKGCFSGGNLDGIGRFDYLNGSFYDGDWKENKKHGKGKFVEADGISIYNGDWDNDIKHGRGTFLQNGSYIIEGVWNKGNLVEMTKFQNYN